MRNSKNYISDDESKLRMRTANYYHSPVVGDDYLPNLYRKNITRNFSSTDGTFSIDTTEKNGTEPSHKTEAQIAEDDKPVKESVIQISVPGAGAAIGWIGKIAVAVVKIVISIFVKQEVKRQTRSRTEQALLEARAERARSAMREAMDRHEAAMKEPGARGREQNAIDHHEERTRGGGETRVA